MTNTFEEFMVERATDVEFEIQQFRKLCGVLTPLEIHVNTGGISDEDMKRVNVYLGNLERAYGFLAVIRNDHNALIDKAVNILTP